LKIKNELKGKFKITDVGNIDFIIGIKFEKLKDGYLLHQKRYLDKILNKFNIDKYKPTSNMLPIINEDLRKKSFDQTKYKKAIGSLLYLAISTRPDVLFAVSKASRKSRNPNYEDWLNVIVTVGRGVETQKGENSIGLHYLYKYFVLLEIFFINYKI